MKYQIQRCIVWARLPFPELSHNTTGLYRLPRGSHVELIDVMDVERHPNQGVKYSIKASSSINTGVETTVAT